MLISSSTVEPKYNTAEKRILANIVDSVVLLPLELIFAAILSADWSTPVLVLLLSILYSSYWMYPVSMHAVHGQTLGKMLCQVKVLDLSECPVSWLQAFRRESVYVLLNVLALILCVHQTLSDSGGFIEHSVLNWIWAGWLGLELLTMYASPKRRALHDFIGRTVVARCEARSKPSALGVTAPEARE